MDFTDRYKAFHSNAAEFTFFLNTHRIFSRIDQILGHKSGLNYTKRLGFFPAYFQTTVFWNFNSIDHKRKFGRNTNTWRLKSILLKNEWVSQEIKEELKRFIQTKENESTTVQNLWDIAEASLRRKHISTQASLKKIRKISNTQANLTPTCAGERTTNKA